jgi:hypothetical protein
MYCILHTNRRTSTERYCVCYEDGGNIVQGTVICTQSEDLQLNVTVVAL